MLAGNRIHLQNSWLWFPRRPQYCRLCCMGWVSGEGPSKKRDPTPSSWLEPTTFRVDKIGALPTKLCDQINNSTWFTFLNRQTRGFGLGGLYGTSTQYRSNNATTYLKVQSRRRIRVVLNACRHGYELFVPINRILRHARVTLRCHYIRRRVRTRRDWRGPFPTLGTTRWQRRGVPPSLSTM